MSQLAAYLKRTNKTQRAAAAELGIDHTYLCKLIAERSTLRPSRSLALHIERWSDGEVTADSWGLGDAKCA